MNALRTTLSTLAVALLAAGCATTQDAAALSASIESIGQWSASAAKPAPAAAPGDAQAAPLPVVSQAARR